MGDCRHGIVRKEPWPSSGSCRGRYMVTCARCGEMWFEDDRWASDENVLIVPGAYESTTRFTRKLIEAALVALGETRWMPDGTLSDWAKSRDGQNHGRVINAIEALGQALDSLGGQCC